MASVVCPAQRLFLCKFYEVVIFCFSSKILEKCVTIAVVFFQNPVKFDLCSECSALLHCFVDIFQRCDSSPNAAARHIIYTIKAVSSFTLQHFFILPSSVCSLSFPLVLRLRLPRLRSSCRTGKWYIVPCICRTSRNRPN